MEIYIFVGSMSLWRYIAFQRHTPEPHKTLVFTMLRRKGAWVLVMWLLYGGWPGLRMICKRALWRVADMRNGKRRRES